MKVWTKEQCIAKLKAEKAKGTTHSQLWDRLRVWHNEQYYKGGKANRDYADACLEMIDKVQREYFPEDAKRQDAEFAKLVMAGTEPYAQTN